MLLRRFVVALALILCSHAVYAAPGMATNAEGGTFPSARTYWFSVGPRERLRLVLDGVEIYKGSGPAVAELPAVEGEERHYDLLAERLKPAPDDGLLDSRSFLVIVDASPPAPPVLSARDTGGWTLSLSSEGRSRVDAVVESDGLLSNVRDLADGAKFDARHLSLLAWAVDAAGNSSEPVAYSGEPLELAVASPASGRWANRQRLVLFSEGAEEVRWTDKGSDPFGPQGQPYTGPVLIDKTGSVRIAIEARSHDGRVQRREISYFVEEKSEEALASLREAEASPVLEESSVPIPAAFRWDAASAFKDAFPDATELRYDGGKSVVLRPVRPLERAYSLLVGDTGVPRRYTFVLGGEEGTAAHSPSPEVDEEGTLVASADSEPPVADSGGAEPPAMPVLRSSGAARALVWPRAASHVRYRLGANAQWSDATAPVPLPGSQVSVEWIVEDGSTESGPFTLQIPAVEGFTDGPQPISSVSDGSTTPAAVILSPADSRKSALFSLQVPGSMWSRRISLSSEEKLVLDVCDGEALRWSVLPDGDKTGRSWIIDRAPPRLPRLEAPAEGSWLTRAVALSVSGEGSTSAKVFRTSPSGEVSTVAFVGSLRLEPSREGPETIRIEAVSVDNAGNASPTVVRSFTLDATTVYAGSDRRTPGEADGSRDRPFETLDQAIAAARAGLLTRVRVIAQTKLLAPVELSNGMIIEGGYRADGVSFGGQSDVLVSPGASFIVDGGAAASLVSLSIAGDPSSAVGLVQVKAASALTLTGCDLRSGPVALEATGAKVSLTECHLLVTGGGSDRASALTAQDSTVSLERCRIDMATAAPVVSALDCRGGTLTLRSVVANVRARGSAFALTLRDLALSAEDSDMTVVAVDYASALDAEKVSFTWKGGSLDGTARDAALVALDGCEGSFADASFRVAAESTARALLVTGSFPSIHDSNLFSAASARSSDAFSGTEPGPRSVGGNRFGGFYRIWTRRYAADDIAAFNRRYAPRDSANVIVDSEDGE